MKYKSTQKRAEEIRRIVAEHYRPGRNDRCKMYVYRAYVRRQYGISVSTFFSYLKEKEKDR
jgi:hypothetical protein